MKKSGLIAIIILVAFAVFVTVKLIGNKKVIEKGETLVDRSHIPVAVNIEEAKMLELKEDISRPSIVEPNETAGIAASMPGKLESLNIELGTKVSKGQVIGKIDTKTLDVQKASLELAVQKMKTDYLRNKELYEGNALSETQYLDSKFGFESRQIELQQLEQQISDAYIKSPLSGIITAKNNVAGEFVNAGTPIATVVDVNLLKIFVHVNQSEVRFVSLGQEADISASIFPGKQFIGKVSYISPDADMNYNYTIEVKVSAKDYPELKPGTYVNVRFKTDTNEKVLQIHKRALVEGMKNAYVYIQNGDRANRKDIRVGRENGEYIEVLDGLKEGDKVVIDGQINILDQSLIQAK